MTYEIRVLRTAAELEAAAPEWETRWRAQARPHLEQHPAWVAAKIREPREEPGAAIVTLYGDGVLEAVAPFLLRRWRCPCRIGYRTLVRFPLRLARLSGERLVCGDKPEAFDRLLEALPAEADVVLFESLERDSLLWRRLHDSPSVRRRYWHYMPYGTVPHHLVRLTGDFEEYLATLGGRSRRKLRNAVRKLEAHAGESLAMDRITRREQLPDFFRHAETVSRKSWQGTQLGEIVRATEEDLDVYAEHADRGWLRSYVLRAGDEPIAFVQGFQAAGTYYYNQIGYDPAWAEHDPGKVLLFRLIEDLCAEDRPDRLDFRYGDNLYKQVFGTDCYDEANLYLIRKTPYGALFRAVHGGCARAAAAARRLLQRLQLRERLRRWARSR
jgi:hypothetical protein